MALTGRSERRKYKAGKANHGKPGRRPKVLKPAARKKLEREKLEAERAAQLAKLRSSNDGTCEPMDVCNISPVRQSVSSTTTPRVRKPNKTGISMIQLPRRVTRATAKEERPKRSPTEVAQYEANSATPTKKGSNAWNPSNIWSKS